MTISLSTAIRNCVSTDLFSDEKTGLLTDLFEKHIAPFWGVEGPHWRKFSKKEMVPGRSLAAYELLGVTVHLFHCNTLSFYLQKLDSGSRVKVHIALLINQDESGSYRAEPKAEKKPKKRLRNLEKIDEYMREYAFLREISHENIFSPREIIYRKDKPTKISIFEHYAKYNLLAYVRSIEDSSAEEGARKLIAIFKGVVSALQYLHERDIMHRDVKLDNVLLEEDADGELVPKLIDLEYRCSVVELRAKVEGKLKEFRDSIADSLDEPVYALLKKKLHPFAYEPLVSEYREEFHLAAVKGDPIKAGVIANYLRRWKSWLELNIRICGTPAGGDFSGNMPKELLSRHIVVKEGDQFAVGKMMEDAIFSNRSLVLGFSLEARDHYNQLIRSLVHDDYWTRPAWPEVLMRLDEVASTFK